MSEDKINVDVDEFIKDPISVLNNAANPLATRKYLEEHAFSSAKSPDYLKAIYEKERSVFALRSALAYLQFLKNIEEEKGIDTEFVNFAVKGIDDRWRTLSGGFVPDIAYKDTRDTLKTERVVKNAFKTLCSLPPLLDEDIYRGSIGGYSLAPEDEKEIREINGALEAMKAHIESYEGLLKKYLDNKIFEQLFYIDDNGTVCAESTDFFSRILLEEPLHANQLRAWMNITRSIERHETTIHELDKKNHSDFTPGESKDYHKATSALAALKNKITLNQSTRGVWGPAIVMIVDELLRAGLGQMDAYRKTAELLSLRYPGIYTDKDPNIIRQHYRYHKKK
jgi:hypothetical protein